MKTFFWDTNLFIYMLEKNPVYRPMVLELRKKIRQQQGQILTSVLTLGEVLVLPYKTQNLHLIQQYKNTFGSSKISMVLFSSDVADIFAQIRASTSVKPPDAFQLACAVYKNVDYFVTNDVALTALKVPGIGKISLLGDILNEIS